MKQLLLFVLFCLVGGFVLSFQRPNISRKKVANPHFQKAFSLVSSILAVNKFEIKNVNKPLDLDKFDLDPAKELQ